MIKAFIFCLSLCSCLAQDVLTSGKVVSAVLTAPLPPFDIPSNIGLTISNRWMSVHFSSNTTGITDWPGESNNLHWVLGTHSGTSSSLTNSANGVWLDGTHFLLGTNFFQNTTLVTFAIFDYMNDVGVAVNNPLFQDDTRGLGFGWEVTGASYPQHLIANANCLIYTNVWTDVIAFGTDSASSGSLYTNGVASDTPTLYGSATTGVGALSYNTFGSGFNGFLKELIIFNNTSITSGQVSNLHYYATHYPYSQ